MGLGVCSALWSARAKNVSGLFDFMYNMCLHLPRVFSAASVRRWSSSRRAFSRLCLDSGEGWAWKKLERKLPLSVCVVGVCLRRWDV